MPRKPLDESCNGSFNCPVEVHTRIAGYRGTIRATHTPLTYGQLLTLRDRRREQEPDDSGVAHG